MAVIEKEKSAPFDNGPLLDNGQYRDYAVLPQSERDKGFVRPVRRSYVHIGRSGPKNPLRDLTDDEKKRYSRWNYVKFEEYQDKEAPIKVLIFTGRFWTQSDLDNIGKGCGTETIMGQELAETYARDPSYYGSTFCCKCSQHLPVNEFVWAGTTERVGS